MLKVANIIEDGRLAGPQVRIKSVAQRLRAYGVETTVVHPTFECTLFEQALSDAGITHVALPIRRLSKGWRSILQYVLFFPWELFILVRLFHREKFHLVHCSGGAWQIKGVLAARLSGTKALWHLNDTLLPNYLRGAFRLLCRHLCSCVIVAGYGVKERYLGNEKFGIPVFEVQAPVDCALYEPSNVVADEMIASSHGINIVTVANLNPLKGLEYFIDMAAQLNKQYIGLHFHIVGPVYSSQDHYFTTLSKQVEALGLANLRFHGPSDDVKRVLKAADIYVCSSISEASPISVWEAMAMKSAIVSTDVGDVSRFIRNGVSGFVTLPRSGEALAGAVGCFIEDVELRKSCGCAAREAALNWLDIKICVEKHANIYRGALTDALS